MAKTIIFEYNDREYTLEYTRRTVRAMEEEGFNVQEMASKPMTMLPALFAGAFKAHHKFVKQDVIDEIYRKMPNKEALVGKLAEMYNDPISTLLEDPEDSEGKVDWKVSW